MVVVGTVVVVVVGTGVVIVDTVVSTVVCTGVVVDADMAP